MIFIICVIIFIRSNFGSQIIIWGKGSFYVGTVDCWSHVAGPHTAAACQLNCAEPELYVMAQASPRVEGHVMSSN